MMCEKLNAVSCQYVSCYCFKMEAHHTSMIQMLPHITPLPIPMPSRRNMKVALHLIQYQTSKHSAAISIFRLSSYLGRPSPLLTPPRRRNNIMHMFLPKPLIMIMHLPPLSRHQSPTRILPQLMLQLRIHPLQPICVLRLQHLGGENAISRRVVYVYVDVLAAHRDYDVHVDLEIMADSFFDEEGVVFVAAPPAAEF